MPKLHYASSTFIMNAGKSNLIVANGYLLVDAVFIFATNLREEYMVDIKTSLHISGMKLIGFMPTNEEGTPERAGAMKAFDGLELGRYGEARLYEEIKWLHGATSRSRSHLTKELRKTLSREGNRYLREQFLKQGEM